MKLRFALLRGVCQTPAYVMNEQRLLEEHGLEMSYTIAPTAWMVPEGLSQGSIDFAVIPWTRIAAAAPEEGLRVICGSGRDEAALVVRSGLSLDEVGSVAVPREGGMKDLTAMALVESMAWQDRKVVRCPSGDGAILAFLGGGADAAAMVEPWAAMLVGLGAGRVVRRTGDVWPGAPCCSLCTNTRLINERPEVVQAVVSCYVRASGFVRHNPEKAAQICAGYVGVAPDVMARALEANLPDHQAIRNSSAREEILELMKSLGYVHATPSDYCDLSFLDRAPGEIA